ncbi:GIY-YIG nuclease family protein [Candidatus Peregrinibacteria bacterium]|nr:GIY-YIG nuclease family protein [Candidatus Peregrinibacteria bacterium]
MKSYYVYILTNKTNNVLYIGVTNDIQKRVYEHKNKLVQSFTAKYRCNKLVFYEETNDINAALQREKQLKNWRRQWKRNLVEQNNPDWVDLSESFD